MTEWIDCKLSDIGEVVGGATPSTKDPLNYDGDIPWLTPKDLSTFTERYIEKGERSITKKGFEGCSTKMLPKNSVLFSSRAPIGYVAIAANEMCTNQGFKSVVPNEKVDYMFLYYLLKYKKDAIEGMGSGTTFKEVSGNVMKNIDVRIPNNINVQKQIAEILDKIDSKIENNNAINRNLSEQAFALFKEMFPNVNQGEHTLGEYLSAVKGKALLSKDAVEGNVPVIAGGLSPATYHNMANTKAPVLTISASGANAGYVALWHQDVWSSDSSYIDSNMTDNVYFWYAMLKTRQKEIFDAQTGSAQPHIYPKNIDVLPVIELDDRSMTEYNMRVSPLFEMIGENLKENDRLSALRDSLLPKLMSGELDVSDLDI